MQGIPPAVDRPRLCHRGQIKPPHGSGKARSGAEDGLTAQRLHAGVQHADYPQGGGPSCRNEGTVAVTRRTTREQRAEMRCDRKEAYL